jgi:mRNA (guanine-N7-)-methyltransferase
MKADGALPPKNSVPPSSSSVLSSHLDHVREHYNKHAAEGNHKTNIESRSQGVSYPLKRFHNNIKRALINRFVVGDRLLDLACGRGGDIRKWFDVAVQRRGGGPFKYCKGLDLSPDEIREAQSRYQEIKNEPRYVNTLLSCEFVTTDKLGTHDVCADGDEHSYGTVSCMFAIHYFFYSETVLRQFFRNVSRHLKNRGYFIATCPDGKRVLAELGSQDEVAKPLLRLAKKWTTPAPECFGSAFTCHIADTVVQAHEGFSEGSLEYLVFSNALKAIAKEFDLFPVEDDWGRDLNGMFEEPRGFIRHFKPIFPSASDPSLADASRLFQAIVLQKRENINAKHFVAAEKYRRERKREDEMTTATAQNKEDKEDGKRDEVDADDEEKERAPKRTKQQL